MAEKGKSGGAANGVSCKNNTHTYTKCANHVCQSIISPLMRFYGKVIFARKEQTYNQICSDFSEAKGESKVVLSGN